MEDITKSKRVQRKKAEERKEKRPFEKKSRNGKGIGSSSQAPITLDISPEKSSIIDISDDETYSIRKSKPNKKFEKFEDHSGNFFEHEYLFFSVLNKLILNLDVLSYSDDNGSASKNSDNKSNNNEDEDFSKLYDQKLNKYRYVIKSMYF